MKRKHATLEELHAAIRKTIEANHGRRVSYRDFCTATGFHQRDIFHHYARWEEAVRGAGFKFKPYHRPNSPGALLAEWGAVVRKLRRLPTQSEYRIHGQREGSLVGRQFGSWLNLPTAFLRYATKTSATRKQWADVLALLRTLPARKPSKSPRLSRRSAKRDDAESALDSFALPFVREPISPPAPARRMRDRPMYGDLVHLPSLIHAPSSEQGVVYLFGVLAERLGFAVERLQTIFPDCKAKRRTGRSPLWQDVLIEFEYASKNFKTHRHDPNGCDIIVCWEHNWPECPKNIEVIALKDQTKRLAASG